MWKNNYLKKITIDNVREIQNSVGVCFCNRFFTHTVGVNAWFGPRITNIPLPTPNYGIENTNYIMDYYRQSYCCPKNLAITRPNIELWGLDAVNATWKFNHNYMEFEGLKYVIIYCGNK